MVEIRLNNAQSGGPNMHIIEDGDVVGTICLHAEQEDMIFWNFEKGNYEYTKLSEMPKKDDVLIHKF